MPRLDDLCALSLAGVVDFLYVLLDFDGEQTCRQSKWGRGEKVVGKNINSQI